LSLALTNLVLGSHTLEVVKRYMGSRVPLGATLVALLALLPAPAPAARGQGETGTIAGSVTVTRVNRTALPASAYARRDVSPKASQPVPETRNVVIYLSGLKPSAPPPAMRARIAQRDEQFTPHVAAVTVGSTVDFPNEDPFFHNVFSLSRAATFNLGRYRSGTSRSEVLANPGAVKVFCQLHSQMSAVVLVLDHPWFTVPADSGSFTIADVPAGEHTVVAWHERIGERREKIRIRPGATTRISFTLPVLEPDS